MFSGLKVLKVLSRDAKIARAAQELLDNGFNYELTSPDGLMFFRKRK